jgi:glycosyltransferase involved in cell wall biosynthesis
MNRDRVLYVSSNGGIHDYRFLKKLVQDYEVLFLHYESYPIINEIKDLKGLQIISKKAWPVKSFPYLSEKKHFKKVYDDFKPGIVHSGYVWQTGVFASHFDIHPHLSMVWGSDILLEPDNNPIIKMYVKKVMKQCDHVQCDAEFVKQKIINDYGKSPDKITVFPWGIDLNVFKTMDKVKCRSELNLENDKFIIIFNRALEKVYGVMDLLEGFKIFSQNKNNVLLLMMSDGTMKSKVKQFIDENNINSKILFKGRVPNTELPMYLNASDVYISTALSDGTSLSLLEALSCSLPVIVTDVPAIKEWVSDSNGITIPAKDPQKVCDALEQYYNDRQLMNTHGELNSGLAKQRADWDKNYLKLKQIYNNLLENK